jgi:hypothetical protein
LTLEFRRNVYPHFALETTFVLVALVAEEQRWGRLWHRPSDAEVNFINKLVKGR